MMAAVGRRNSARGDADPETRGDVHDATMGAFGDGRGLVGALGLGADAINMGTRFMATKEAPIHENVKQALIKNDELNTKLIMRTLRNTERTLHNTVVDKVLEVESRGNTKIEDLIPFVSGLGGKKMLEEGDLESGILSAGQSMGFVHDIPTVQELMDRIMKQAEDIIKEKFTQVISPS